MLVAVLGGVAVVADSGYCWFLFFSFFPAAFGFLGSFVFMFFSFGSLAMAMLADHGDAGGGSRWCCCGGRKWWRFWRLKAAVEKERERREVRLAAEMRGEAGFLSFGPNSLHLWTMKIKSIYRRWKKDTFSLLVPNLGLWFDPKTSQPLVQSSNDELSVLCRKNRWSGWPLWGGATTS